MAKETTLIIGGLSGTGSTTAAKDIAKRLGYEHVYGGGIFRKMASEAGQPLERYMTELADHPDRERKVDDRLLARAGEGKVVVESRVLHWLLPADGHFTAWLTCEFGERVRRIREREPFRDETDARHHVSYRDRIDADRYRKLYGVDIADFTNLDLVVDTTKIPAGTAADRILEAFRA